MSSNDEGELQRAISEAVTIVEHDPSWVEIFSAERERLQLLLPAELHGIEHVGSTAVPGLAAKPIVDIMAGVESMTAADRVLTFLCGHGYTTSFEFNATLVDRRWLMRQHQGRRTHHLHLVVPGSHEWDRTVSFRDILLGDADRRRAYEALKRRLAETLGHDREAYTAAKGDFINRALAGEAFPE